MQIIFPPRPRSKISPNQIGMYSNDPKWVAQRKFNGQRNLIHISSDRKVSFFGRHGEPHKKFKLTADLVNEIKQLNFPENEYWLDSELLDAKTSSVEYKQKVVIFDVLHAGRYLLGRPTQEDRIAMLCDICGNPKKLESVNGIALEVTPNVWMAQTFSDNFEARFREIIDLDEIEGLILRKKDSVLDQRGLKEYEVGWQIRCRKAHKNYNF